MSQTTATARVRSPRRLSAPPTPSRPALRVVTPAAPAKRQVPFVALCSVLLGLGLIALLMLNTALATGSYQMHDLQSRSALLTDQENALRESLSAKEAPANLAAAALKLGMVQGGTPRFLDLKDGSVSAAAAGSGAPAVAPNRMRVVESPTKNGTSTGTASATPGAGSTPSAAAGGQAGASSGAPSQTPSKSASTKSASTKGASTKGVPTSKTSGTASGKPTAGASTRQATTSTTATRQSAARPTRTSTTSAASTGTRG